MYNGCVCIPSWCRGREVKFSPCILVNEPSSIGWESGCINPTSEFKWCEFRFLFILEDYDFLGLMQFILRTRFMLYPRLKILILILNGCIHSWCIGRGSEVLPQFQKMTLRQPNTNNKWLSKHDYVHMLGCQRNLVRCLPHYNNHVCYRYTCPILYFLLYVDVILCNSWPHNNLPNTN
jgi:hypothetical protein